MARIKRTTESFEGDPLVPLLNLVCLLIPLLLFGAVFMRFVVIDVSSPKICRGEGCKSDDTGEQPLQLTVVITDRGFHLKANPAHRFSRLREVRSDAPEIPKTDAGWDFVSLSKKLRSIKDEYTQETQIILGAEDDIPFDVLIKTMDFARGVDGNLFPDVTLGRGVV